ncbi:hypothetical protein GGF50DRAFT_43673 [Schizophyllum commune]
MCLLDLPVELLAEALQHLGYRHLLRIRQVCRSFRDAIDHTARLRYHLELAREGMQDGSRHDLGSADRLQKLKEYKQAWRALDWSANSKVLHGGVFAISGDIVACSKRTEPTHITFTRIESKLRGVEGHQWKIDAPRGLRDFVIEPVLDLVVVLIDGSATKPIIPVPLTFVAADFKPMIYEDRLGVLFTSHSLSYTYFTVWNWQTGEKYRRPFRARRVPSATFLTRDLVAMPYTCYNLDDHTTSTTALLVADISDPHKPHRVCRLFLPPAAPDITLFADFIWDQPLSRASDRLRPGWFAPASQERVLGLSVSGFDVDFGTTPPTSTMFIISVPHVVERIQQRLATSGEKRATFEWAEWGPDCSRIFSHNCPALWLSFIHGTKYAILDDEAVPPTGYTVYDFSRSAVQDPQGENPEANDFIIKGRDVFAERGAFATPVETGLPYRSMWRPLEPEVVEWIGRLGGDTGSVMLIEDGVVFSPDAGGEYWAWTV